MEMNKDKIVEKRQK